MIMSDLANKIPKLVATYYRVSTAMQEENQTIQTQISAVKEFADKNNLKIVQEYKDDGWSGDSLIRPALDQLRVDVKKKMWDAVLIYDPDRLARRYSYQELVMDELRDAMVEIIFVTTPAPKNSEDKILHGVKGLFAEYERAKITERFRLGKLRKVKEGHLLVSEALYGYRYIPKVEEGGKIIKHGYYEINDSEARVVKMMFNSVANDGLTIRALVKKLHGLGIKPRRSKRGVWNTSTVSKMLRNEAYIGKAHWGSSYAVVPEKPFKEQKYKKVKKTSRRDRPKEEWYFIPIPPLVDEKTFTRTRERLEINYALCKRNKKNDYLLANKIFCTCGRKRAGEGPQRGKHLYYRCTNRVYSFPLSSSCKEKGINARIADKLVWNKISNLMSDPELMKKQIARWQTSKEIKAQYSDSDLEFMTKEITKLKSEEDRYNKAYGAGVFTIEQLREYTLPIKEKIISLDAQISAAKQEKNNIQDSSIPDSKEMEVFAQQAKNSLKSLSFGLKREIVMNVVDKIIATPKELKVYGYIPVNNYVGCKINDRHRWASERGEIHAF